MTLHLFNNGIRTARPSAEPTPPPETATSLAVAAIIGHPIMFVMAVWAVFCLVIFFIG